MKNLRKNKLENGGKLDSSIIKNTPRNVSIDALKIVSMIMVVILHATNYGVKSIDMSWSSANYWICQVLHSFSMVAVNCFVLITGYFFSTSKVGYKRLLPLWVQVELYSVGVYLLLCALPFFSVTFNFKIVIKMALPLLTDQYWFFTCYFLLIIVAPFLNRFIASLDCKEYKRVLAVLLLVFSVVPTINIFNDRFGTSSGYSLLWFCILYLVSGYIRKFDVLKKNYWIFYVMCSLLNVLIAMCGEVLSGVPGATAISTILCNHYNSVLVFAASIFLFLAVVQAKQNYRKFSGFITKIASLSFGVYLLHENSQFKDILWNKIVCLSDASENVGLFTLKLIGSVLAIFIVGVFVDWIRSILRNGMLKVTNRYIKNNIHQKGDFV